MLDYVKLGEVCIAVMKFGVCDFSRLSVTDWRLCFLALMTATHQIKIVILIKSCFCVNGCTYYVFEAFKKIKKSLESAQKRRKSCLFLGNLKRVLFERAD